MGSNPITRSFWRELPRPRTTKAPDLNGRELFACRKQAVTLESYLTLSEAARKYGVSTESLTRLVKDGIHCQGANTDL